MCKTQQATVKVIVYHDGENQHTFIKHSEIAFPPARDTVSYSETVSNKFDEPFV